MNTYAKLCPNVFVAKCPDTHQKGDVIILTSKYGKETEVEIHNLVKTSEDAYFYSFTRCDGVNSQVRAEQNAVNNIVKLLMKAVNFLAWENQLKLVIIAKNAIEP